MGFLSQGRMQYAPDERKCRCRSAAVSEVESFAPATIAIPAEITGENPDWNPP